jgi:hypothetical protein
MKMKQNDQLIIKISSILQTFVFVLFDKVDFSKIKLEFTTN